MIASGTGGALPVEERIDTVLLAGAGRMGGALLGGWLSTAFPARGIAVLDPHPSAALGALCAARGVALNPSDPHAVETVVLAVKPQMLEAAAPGLEPWVGSDVTLVSVVAGKSLEELRRRFPRAAAIVRAMPNLPAAVGRGITGVVAHDTLADAVKRRVERLLAAVGRVEWLARERDVDVVTAVSGSGPAYVFLLVEALGRAAERAGLAPDLAARLGRATVEGAGELLFRSPDVSAATLRNDVTSPGGTTAAALAVLMADQALETLIGDAVAAAFVRAGELSR